LARNRNFDRNFAGILNLEWKSLLTIIFNGVPGELSHSQLLGNGGDFNEVWSIKFKRYSL
jgi:hypothetical protein